jgi:outer membrane lipoprotein-sorting protein
MKKSLILAVVCANLLATGCGSTLSAVPSRSSSALSAFKSAWAAVTAYSATITVSERKNAKVQNMVTKVFKYTFRRPSTVTVDVVGGPKSGVSLLWTGGTTVIAHRGSGLGGMLKKTLSLHDPQITTARGSSIDELSFGHILAHAQQTPGKISQGPVETINGVATEAVTLIPTRPATDAGYTREIIEISRTTHLPLRVLGYQGPTLVRKIDFVDVKVTP